MRFPAGKGYGHWKLEKHAVRLLIAGPVLWLLGSVHNACQIFERADGHVQILQLSVRTPFLIGCLLLLAGSVINSRDQMHQDHHGTDLLGGTCNLGLSRDLRQLRLPGGRQNECCKSIQEAAWRRPRQADERE
uniref:Uncharacterized protein n=1 Tax=Kalanchoe fedtschenkoi TaxID=63787 RepID=A0A7N0U900_KALFE